MGGVCDGVDPRAGSVRICMRRAGSGSGRFGVLVQSKLSGEIRRVKMPAGLATRQTSSYIWDRRSRSFGVRRAPCAALHCVQALHGADCVQRDDYSMDAYDMLNAIHERSLTG